MTETEMRIEALRQAIQASRIRDESGEAYQESSVIVAKAATFYDFIRGTTQKAPDAA